MILMSLPNQGLILIYHEPKTTHSFAQLSTLLYNSDNYLFFHIYQKKKNIPRENRIASHRPTAASHKPFTTAAYCQKFHPLKNCCFFEILDFLRNCFLWFQNSSLAYVGGNCDGTDWEKRDRNFRPTKFSVNKFTQ